MRVAVIDADTIIWTAAYLAQRDGLSPEKMIRDLDTFMRSILKNTKADKYVGFMQGPDNFRKRMFPDYKGTRPEVPEWFRLLAPSLRKYLHEKWKIDYTTDGFEADDAVASVVHMLETWQGDDNKCYEWLPLNDARFECIVCAVDKDLKQIPGEHYNYKTAETIHVGRIEAWTNMCMQLLHGDTSDNIPNVRRGIGPAKAKKILESENLPEHMVVLEEFCKDGGYEGLVKFAENVLKVVLRRDKQYKFKLNDIPTIDYSNLLGTSNARTNSTSDNPGMDTSNGSSSSTDVDLGGDDKLNI